MTTSVVSTPEREDWVPLAGILDKALAAISDEAFRRAMAGVHLICAHRGAVKEEAPQAYKDIDEVVDVVRQAGLARVVARLRPLAVLKG